MAATDIRHERSCCQPGFNAVERGDPFAGEVCAVTGAEEPLGALEQTRVMITPRERPIAGERCLDLLEVHEHRPERVHPPRGEHRRRVVSERRRSLRAQRVAIRCRAVCDKSSGDLSIQPFTDEPRIAAGRVRDLLGAPRRGFGEVR